MFELQKVYYKFVKQVNWLKVKLVVVMDDLGKFAIGGTL
jgi:hypothetical protein